MALLKIINYPDPRLRTKSKPVEIFVEALVKLKEDMIETMYAAPGIGLAAVQIGKFKRMLVIDITEEKNAPQCFINPQITASEGVVKTEEGCLSVPAIYEPVKRFEKISIKAQDEFGEFFELEAEGLMSVCIQHEIDHLDGKLFVDYLSQMKQVRIRKKMEKLRKETF